MLLSAEAMSIRGLEAADLDAVLELLQSADLPEQGVREELGAFAIAECSGRVVGCAGVERYGSDGLLRSVAVAPTHRCRGIARELVRHLAQRSQRAHLRALFLLTTTARDYFARLGFEPCPRELAPAEIRSSWEYRAGCPATAALMRMPLE